MISEVKAFIAEFVKQSMELQESHPGNFFFRSEGRLVRIQGACKNLCSLTKTQHNTSPVRWFFSCFQMCSRISKRGCVRPSVRPSVEFLKNGKLCQMREDSETGMRADRQNASDVCTLSDLLLFWPLSQKRAQFPQCPMSDQLLTLSDCS